MRCMGQCRIGTVIYETGIVRDTVLDECYPFGSGSSNWTWISWFYSQDHTWLDSGRDMSGIEGEVLTRVHRPYIARFSEIATPRTDDIVGRGIDHESYIIYLHVFSVGSTCYWQECEHSLLPRRDERCEMRILIDIDTSIELDKVLIESIFGIVFLVCMYPLVIFHDFESDKLL